MKLQHPLAFAALLGLLVGCADSANKGQVKNSTGPTQGKEPNKPATPVVDEAKIKEGLAQLSKEERDEAEIQKFCAVHDTSRLGAMGKPVKIKIKDKAGEDVEVYLCCASCEAEARKNEAKTAARVLELNVHGQLAKLSPEDQKAAEAQKYCVTSGESRLGSMGVPTKVMVKDKEGNDHPVFFCCGGCERIIKKEGAEKVLSMVEDLKKKNAPAK